MLTLCARYLYTLFLAVDANFKLRQKNRGITDLELAPGWAYFVKQDRYLAFIKDYADQPEVFLLAIEFGFHFDNFFNFIG
jgi:hypothetical protein